MNDHKGKQMLFCILFEARFFFFFWLFLFHLVSASFSFSFLGHLFSTYPPSTFSFPCSFSQDSMSPCSLLFSVFTVLFSVYFFV